MSQPKPFKINADQNDIDAILNKVRAYQWHQMPQIEPSADPWIYGTDMSYMKELCAYWLDTFNWRQHETELNKFNHFTAEIDGQPIHFIHETAQRAHAKTLLLTHGWPGSILEFSGVIAQLAHPEQFGGNAKDGVNVIAPSLPGYAWSGKPPTPIGPRRTAEIWDKLMRETLGISAYIAQGGDWGAVVSGYLGLNHAAPQGGCEAIHLNMYGLRAADIAPETDEEKNWATAAQMMFEMEGAYLRLQMTKPQTLSYAMMDSPVGVCAWIVEKFHRWSDRREKNASKNGAEHIENAFTKDQLLANVMIYLLTQSFNTATWFYRGMLEEGGADIPAGQKVNVPVGIAAFPAEFIPFPPRRMVEAGYNVRSWRSFERGGHFAAMEEPELFIQEMRDFISAL